jgi:3-methyladenine DNA glycosylase AlkD
MTRRLDLAREVATIEAALADRGTVERAEGAKAYLKSDLEFFGVDAKGIRTTAREVFDRHPNLGHDDLVRLVRALWQRPTFDDRGVAAGLLERRRDLLGADDLELVEELLRQSGTWALVDWLCTKVAAPLVEGDPALKRTLKRWARDDDFWLRRSSMLSLLPALRRGEGDFELFSSFASAMVEEKEFFIRKAIGWVLRDTSKKRPELAYEFLSAHIDRVSGLTLREGSKYLPEEQREGLRRRYRQRGKREGSRG